MENEHRPEIKETKEHFSIEFSAESVASERHPDRNEDFYIADKEHGIFAVLDGMGGHAAGDVASGIAGKALYTALSEIPQDLPLSEFKARVREAVLIANQAIAQKIAQDPDHLKGMGTTLTLVLLRKEADGTFNAVYTSIGDSRFYISYSTSTENENKLAQMSHDDDLVNAIADPQERERIKNVLDSAKSQSELQGAGQFYWNNRNVIANALKGQPGLDFEVHSMRVYPGEKMGITSDGVHDNLAQDEIILESAQALVASASARQSDQSFRSKKIPDDITAVVFEIKEDAVQPASPKESEWDRARVIFAQLGYTYGIHIIEAAKDISAVDHEKGARLLQEVLPLLPREKLEKLKGRHFQPQNANSVRQDGMIAFDVNGSPESLREYLEGLPSNNN